VKVKRTAAQRLAAIELLLQKILDRLPPRVCVGNGNDLKDRMAQYPAKGLGYQGYRYFGSTPNQIVERQLGPRYDEVNAI
jgi:hypothetical protein